MTEPGQGNPLIGFNLLWLVPGVVGGTEEATVELLTCLKDDPPDDLDYRLYALEPFAAAHPEIVEHFPTRLAPLTGRMKPLRVAAEGSWLARQARQDGVDLLHHGGGTLPPGSWLPAVVTIHDLQPFDMPGYFSPAKRAYLRWAVPHAARNARLILTLSEFVRQRIVERFSADPDQVRVVRAGVRPQATPDIPLDTLRRRYGLPRRWFVYPAITYPHKNHVTLVRAFAQVADKEPDVGLVLTGRAAGSEGQLRDEIEGLGLTDRVRRTGRIPRDDLMALIGGSVGLAFPSRYEGFGLPVLEAMALDTPVIAARATALIEVVGDAGQLVGAHDVDGWVAAMLSLLNDEVRQQWLDRGRARAAELSWAAATKATVQAHHDALRRPAHRRMM